MTQVVSEHFGRKPRVLLADDQPVYLAEMAELLRAAGYDCLCLADPRQIEDELSTGNVDVLVADIRMPGNFNLELVERVRSSAHPPAVILMTGFPTLETAINSIKLKISAYLVKPFGYEELLAEVQAALQPRAEEAQELEHEPLKSGIIQLGNVTDLVARHPEMARLTRREYEVLLRVLMGDDVPVIGSSLYISPHTVRNHLKAIYRKLDVRSRVELVVRFGPVQRIALDQAAQS
jgi:DNA-binding NarL/FixJ family response regulator